MDADGSNVVRLTTNSVSDSDWLPAWSPDGRRIAFQSNRDGDTEIYVMNADGSNTSRLTNNFFYSDSSPDWSPDGSRIAFHSTRDGGFEIYAMDADGSNVVRLTNNSVDDANPSWSPDGRRIAFDSNRDGDSEIYAMDPDGSNVVRLTDNSAVDVNASWGAAPPSASGGTCSSPSGSAADVGLLLAALSAPGLAFGGRLRGRWTTHRTRSRNGD